MTQALFASWAEVEEKRVPGRYELLRGRVVRSPVLGYPDTWVAQRLARLIGNFVTGRRLGESFDGRARYELPSGDTVSPDYSYVSQLRYRSAPRPAPGKGMSMVPELVVEILSVESAGRDRGEKKDIYEQNGVQELWLIHPHAREMTVHHLSGKTYDPGLRLRESQSYSSHLLQDLEFTVGFLLP
ncbi:MAG TPA: Uma2 family endonuclease [Polyangia bacterium]|nr:Uma2 family endonuclease [Polyangia bacterium]